MTDMQANLESIGSAPAAPDHRASSGHGLHVDVMAVALVAMLAVLAPDVFLSHLRPNSRASSLRFVGDMAPTIVNGFRLDADAGEAEKLLLPGGALLVLDAGSRFIFSGDSAPTMNALLIGDATIEVPVGTSWHILTMRGEVRLAAGLYGIRTWTWRDSIVIVSGRGRVDAFGLSIDGAGRLKFEGEPRDEDDVGLPILPQRVINDQLQGCCRRSRSLTIISPETESVDEDR